MKMNSSLRFILDPLTVEKFLADHYQKRALHISGDRDRFASLFGWEALNGILNSSSQLHSGIRMSQGGKQFKPADALDLIGSVQNGATLIVEHVDRHNLVLGDFLDRLSEEIGQETRFNMYLSYPENQGFNNHYDTQDFFILQVSGYKEWWIFPETTPSISFYQKSHGMTPPPSESCYLHCTLEPGDVLYVPRGHWHYAIARKEPSMHLTLAVFVKTGIDFMKWLVDELTDYEEFRRALPIALSSKYGHEEKEHFCDLGKLKLKLFEVLNEGDLFGRFLEFKTARSCNRQPFQFPDHTVQSLADCKQTSCFKRRAQSASVSMNKSGKVELICGGRRLMFDGKTERILRLVFSSDQFTGEELLASSKEMSWQTICSILLPLVREGFISSYEI